MFHRLGTLVVLHPRRVLVIGVIALLGAIYLATSAFGKLDDAGFDDPASESTRAATALEEGFGDEAGFLLTVSADGGKVTEGDAAKDAQSLVDRLRADDDLTHVVSYLDTPGSGMVSDDGAHGLISVAAKDPDNVDAAAVIDRYTDDTATDGSTLVHVGGRLAIFEEISSQLGSDLGLAEAIAIPLMIALLVLAFGNVVAAFVTIGVGGFAIAGTFAELSVLGNVTDVSIYALNLTTGLGLGLAVDYGLLMVARVREERAAGAGHADAVVRAVETAGRTIVFSATTVAVSLAALLVFPLYFLRSSAYAGIGVMIITAVVAVVLLPATIMLLGDRIDALRVPGVRGLHGGAAPFWTRLARFVTRRPWVALPVVAMLIAMATPLAGIQFGTPDDRVLSASAGSRQAGDLLREEFGGDGTSPIRVVTTSAIDAKSLGAYAADLSRVDDVDRVDTRVGTYADGSLVSKKPALAPGDGADELAVVNQLDRQSEEARDLVRDVRAVPAPPGATALVGGGAAELLDSLDAIGAKLPYAAGGLALAMVVILFLFTGSLVQPLRALTLNVIGLGATVGTMVVIFQEGFGADLLGFTALPLNVSMVVLLLVIAFGLSMDYEVFVLGRITEMRRRGLSNVEAVVQGLAHTGRIVTTAAALIATSFFAFLVSDVSFMKFFGLGVGLAILIDAVLVRGILLPAAMRMLGEAAWWAPRPLRRLHSRVGLSEEPATAPHPVTV
ncbi:RND superfamily putative drug exporter [Nocardioides albertanoniae]|uniref:RND superfamily putative drug exporter n=1 Tax=Nocardioides albertanoniae TaxID=1175486 RepID=A0A543A4E3_9ACTN|nr:MMPL family transporter [Nocardioides albertanoniae]TQL67463.1 RND superfamily putative drug exporter [Nocardioides albertanoniae]